MKKSSKRKKQSKKRGKTNKSEQPGAVDYVEHLMQLNKMQDTLLKKLHKLL